MSAASCPECTQGKPWNCTGWALDASDELTLCRSVAPRPAGVVTDVPAERPGFMADEGYPVSGDRIARFLDGFPLPDFLWSAVRGEVLP
jgi:hypothetical protein